MREELEAKQGGAIRGMFGRIAHRYDLLNHLLSLGQDLWWRRVLSKRLASLAPEGPVLDLCTGTGDLAFSLGRERVLGADFCLPMLAEAARKGAGKGLDWVAADALHLPLPESHFTAATVAFGVRNFAVLDRGLGELQRVLRPGGWLLILEFSQPRGLLAPFQNLWSRSVPPLVGRLVSGDSEAYSYLPASIETFPDAEAMVARLGALGFVEASATSLSGGVVTLYQARRNQGEST